MGKRKDFILKSLCVELSRRKIDFLNEMEKGHKTYIFTLSHGFSMVFLDEFETSYRHKFAFREQCSDLYAGPLRQGHLHSLVLILERGT